MLSRARWSSISGMDDADSALAKAYIKRIRDLRIARGLTQAEMAVALGLPVERYKKYETRSVMPPYMVPRFAAIVGRTVEFVISGRNRRLSALPSQSR